ncbi:cell wall metabolism sensor histidine kinase WalK [Psychrobacillus sp. OK032]|uniref:sensor histidine kinase n=1 Tax=Psychrobacillus sp. OK032 TaxID=1884358 RepID=UPI0008BE39BE|nr:HAMP domain-containing sensor histidine kinase [Psychrobacillus sp. OK032]SER56292.1 HAMP domain-containing protein [Psychrobacillus sp. OK032]
MRTTRIQTFTIICLFFILLLPWLFFVTSNFIETKSFRIGMNDIQKEHLETTIHSIESNSHNWMNPTWQERLTRQLQELNMDVSIHSESNQLIFTTNPDQSFLHSERFSIIDNGEIKARVEISYANSRSIQMVATIVGLIMAIIIIALVMRKYILKPLEQMSANVRQIAEGNLDVELPISRITEIAEVHEGFKVMVKGLKESIQKQVELEEQRRFVIAAVAHDLRTPLFALRGYLDGLEQGIADSPDKMAKYLAVCKEKSAQLDRLVEDLFTYTKTEYLELELKKAIVDFPNLLQHSIESLSMLARQKNISITLNHLGDDCVIIGDWYLLNRAMNNIIDNAVRHTPQKGKILIQCYKDGNKIVFAVQDTGEGFTSEELQRVFEPLYRGEVSRNRLTGGSGLGLTISQRIIRLHGGDLAVGNHTEGGAILTGWIPLKK